MALPAKIVEVALAKTTEKRKRLLEMAMPALQRTRLARLDMLGAWLGMEDSKPSSRSSSESAGASSGRGARHGDADRQLVPDGAVETDLKVLNSANTESSSGRSETRLCLSETNTGKGKLWKRQTRCSQQRS